MRADVITSKLVLASYRLLICASLLVLLGMVSVSPVLAQLDPKERPATQDLLPETTVSFFQVDNFRDLVEKLQDTTIAQMFEEESIAGLRDGLIEEAKQAYQDNKDEFTPEFEDLSSLPAGEMTFAVIAPRRKNLEYMLILELNEEDEALDRVLDSGREFLENEAPDSVTKEDANQDGVEYETFLFEGRPFRFFRLGGLMVGSTSESELDAFLDRWAGRENEKVRPLSSNRKFITIMNRCLGNSELRPEARFFVDPIQFAKSYTRGNVSAQFVLNFLPALGLDGLLGVGGSLLLAEEDFEVVMHTHLLLSDPRTGIFEMIALKPTDYEPEPWLPADSVSYMTTSWNVDQMMNELGEIVEAFNGEGSFEKSIQENINEKIGLDLKEDLLAHLTGRVTYCQWMEPPIKLNSQVNVIALEIENLEEFEKSLEAVIDRINQGEDGDDDAEERIEETDYKGVRVWAQPIAKIEERIERRKERFRKRREKQAGPDGEDRKSFTELAYGDLSTPQPSFALIGSYLVFSPQSKIFLEHAIDTDQGDSEPLAEDAKFKTINDKLANLLKNELPSAMMYSNPEESFRMLYELYNSDSTRALISRGAEDNKYLDSIRGRMEDNPLPEFDDMKKYFKPSGGFVLSDETGYHALVFTLRGDPEE